MAEIIGLRVQHDFSLHSGERQFASALGDIRGDHINRYRFGLQNLKFMGLNPKSCYGLGVFCGHGYGRYIAAREEYHILAIDTSEDTLSAANKNNKSNPVFFAQK
jgi:2-polyprenyl-3-methyl-5-hydroxy-6-metoxy-1,4-benzoquinol methylase